MAWTTQGRGDGAAVATWLMAFSDRPDATSLAGAYGVSQFSRVDFPRLPGIEPYLGLRTSPDGLTVSGAD